MVQTFEDDVCVTRSPLLLKCPKMTPFIKIPGRRAEMERLLAGSFQIFEIHPADFAFSKNKAGGGIEGGGDPGQIATQDTHPFHSL